MLPFFHGDRAGTMLLRFSLEHSVMPAPLCHIPTLALCHVFTHFEKGGIVPTPTPLSLCFFQLTYLLPHVINNYRYGGEKNMTDKDNWVEATPGDTWKPEEKGDEIIGVLVDVQSDVGQNNSMLYTLEDPESRERKSVWGSAVLDPRMRAVPVGSKVKITFKGLGEKKGGKQAPKLFEVHYVKPEGDDIPF